jgi:hypothetical protein
MLEAPEAVECVLQMVQNLSQVDAPQFAKVVKQWELTGKPPLAQFAPYSFYCIRMTMFHHFGLLRGFFTTGQKIYMTCNMSTIFRFAISSHRQTTS